MKLIIAGSTGKLATGLIRHALSHPEIKTVVALGRREISPPENLGPKADTAKLKTVILKDFENYTEDVKEELSGADAVIWTIAITPSKVKTVGWEQACKVSRDYALKGIETISTLPKKEGKTSPLRFIYMSGNNAERDPNKKPWVLGDYSLMRGDAEARILAYAQQSNGAVEACVAKVGLIMDPSKDSVFKGIGAMALTAVVGVGTVHIDAISSGLLDQVLHGFEKDTLKNVDMVRIGERVLGEVK